MINKSKAFDVDDLVLDDDDDITVKVADVAENDGRDGNSLSVKQP